MFQFTKRARFYLAISFVMLAGLTVALGAKPVTSNTTEELEARVAELRLILEELQRQLILKQDLVLIPRELAYGAEGPEVRDLQKFLNRTPETQVAFVGPGSPGFETMYYGALTSAAVKRYQELHSEELLAPVDRTLGTGVLDLRTRTRINNEITRTRENIERDTETAADTENENESEETENSEQNEDDAGALPAEYDGDLKAFLEAFDVDPSVIEDVVISGVSSHHARRGEVVTVTGYGFTKENNTIHFDETHTIKLLTSPSQERIVFTVPSDLPLGLYNFSISNENGDSGDDFFLVVYEGAYVPPTVTSITPKEGLYGEEVTIYGTGFTPEGNQVRASYAIIEDLSSPDGTTLTFKVKPPVFGETLEEGVDLGFGIENEYYFYVVNGNGLSPDPVSFTGRI